MHKVNNLFTLFLWKTGRNNNHPVNQFYSYWIVSFIIIFNAYSQDIKPIIAVPGLDNKGGISEALIDTICTRISTIIETTKKYYVFQREFIPIVFKESGFTVTNGIYSITEKLVDEGVLLSVDEIIGGTISRKNGSLELILKRIDVNQKIQLSIQEHTTSITKKEFLEIQLPQLVTNLLLNGQNIENIPAIPVSENPESNISDSTCNNKNTEKITNHAEKIEIISNIEKQDTKSPVIREKHRKKAPILIVISGVVLAGAATGAYLYYDSKEHGNPNIPQDVPLDPLPDRTR